MFNLKKGGVNCKYIVIIGILIILVIGGLWGYQRWLMSKEETKTETESSGYAVDWQVYESEEYGFEVQYPEGYLIHKTLNENMEVDGFYIVSEGVTRTGYQLAIEFTEKSIDERIQEIEILESESENYRIVEISQFGIGSDMKVKTEVEHTETITMTMYFFEGFTLTQGVLLDEDLADKMALTFKIIN